MFTFQICFCSWHISEENLITWQFKAIPLPMQNLWKTKNKTPTAPKRYKKLAKNILKMKEKVLSKSGVKFSILAHVDSIWMELEMKLECEIERNVCLKYICVPKPFERLFQKVMQKALISWIRVRKFITTDKRKLFYEPSSAKLNSWNFLFISQRSSRIMFPKGESDSTCLNCV